MRSPSLRVYMARWSSIFRGQVIVVFSRSRTWSYRLAVGNSRMLFLRTNIDAPRTRSKPRCSNDIAALSALAFSLLISSLDFFSPFSPYLHFYSALFTAIPAFFSSHPFFPPPIFYLFVSLVFFSHHFSDLR